ncbi:MAG: DUF3017 domain-containing protein [Propionibacteriaceae bacterium]|jgi:hypothetical protein|nr:DUF3017 domain-containing protein [Propionibacteriaceae bacterium]
MAHTPLVDQPGLLGKIRRQWPWVVMVSVMAVGLLLITTQYWRRGALLIGGGVLLGGLLRAVLTDAGILTVRDHKIVDVVLYGLIGTAIIVVAFVVPRP